MAFRWFQSLFVRETKRFNIYKEYSKAINPENRLKENPYYEKYAGKISELQKISPEEFKQMLNEKLKKPGLIEKEMKHTKQEVNAVPRFSGQKDLNQIMKLDSLEEKSAQEIESIWSQYHHSKDGLYATLPKSAYVDMYSKLQSYPNFLFPIPRAQGYEFFVHQFMEHTCYFTSLINFQAFKENAPVSLSITYFTELMDTKGIVLMRGEYDDKQMRVQEAQCLANQLQLYYGTKDGKRENLLRTFNKKPDLFRHMDLISNFEYDLIK